MINPKFTIHQLRKTHQIAFESLRTKYGARASKDYFVQLQKEIQAFIYVCYLGCKGNSDLVSAFKTEKYWSHN